MLWFYVFRFTFYAIHYTLSFIDIITGYYRIIDNYRELRATRDKLPGVFLGIHIYFWRKRCYVRFVERKRLPLCSELKLGTLNELFFLITPAQLQVREGKELNSFSRDKLRARMIREKLSILK